jgi:hypothetical protein
VTYQPQNGDEGFALLKAALRDYIAADLSAYGLPSVVELLPQGAASIVDEGFLTDTMPTPLVMFTTVGDGQSEDVRENTLARFIVYVVDRGRGLSSIERVLHRVRKRLNRSDVALDFLTFPADVDIRIENIEAKGSTASVSLPAWKAEARGLYLFIVIRGLEADF